MIKKLLPVLLCTLSLFMLSSCSQTTSSETKENKSGINSTEESSSAKDKLITPSNSKIKISVTFNAMKELVSAVGKEKVSISTIIPDGQEPHDFEPKAKDLVDLSTAQIFVYNGLGMESWVDKAISSSKNSSLVTVNASDGIEPITNTDSAEISEHGQYDPHIWISLKNAEIIASNIKNALVQVDPQNESYYTNNYNDFVTSAEQLYNEYNQKFTTVSNKSFVTGHAAFAYLCRDYGLTQNSVEDVFAEGEPSAQQLVKLVDYCKKNNVTTIFAEELASPDVSKTLADEVGAKVETIYTLESREDGKSYLSRMESNLKEIYESLSNAK